MDSDVAIGAFAASDGATATMTFSCDITTAIEAKRPLENSTRVDPAKTRGKFFSDTKFS